MTNAKRRLLYSIRAKLAAYSQKRGLNKLEALNEALDIALTFERGVFSKPEFKVMLRELSPVKLNKTQIYYLKNKKYLNARRSRNRRIKQQRKVV